MKKLALAVIIAAITVFAAAGCGAQTTVKTGQYVLDGNDAVHIEIVNFRMLKLKGFEPYLAAIQEAWFADANLKLSGAQKEKIDLVKKFSPNYELIKGETADDDTRIFSAKFETDDQCTRIFVAVADAYAGEKNNERQLCVTFEYSEANKTITLRLSGVGEFGDLVFKQA